MRVLTILVFVGILCSSLTVGSAGQSSDGRPREPLSSLVPYVGDRIAAWFAVELAASTEDYLRSTDHPDRLAEAALRYDDARRSLLGRLKTLDAELQSAVEEHNHEEANALRAINERTAGDVLLLAWQLAKPDRIALLRDASIANLSVEQACWEALFFCVSQEISSADPRVVPKELRPNIEQLRGSFVNVNARSLVWMPDKSFYPLDAADLIAGLAGARGIEHRKDLALNLIALGYSCLAPDSIDPRALTYREGDVAVVVANEAIIPFVKQTKEELDRQGHEAASLLNAFIGALSAHLRQEQALDVAFRKLEDLNVQVRKNAKDIARLSTAIDKTNERIDLVASDLRALTGRVEVIEITVNDVMSWLRGELEVGQQNELLQMFAPILRHDETASGPLMRPSEYVEDAEIVFAEDTSERLLATVPRGRVNAEGLIRWLESELPPDQHGNRGAVADAVGTGVKLIPHKARARGLAADRSNNKARAIANDEAIRDGTGVFGLVLPDAQDAGVFHVKYFFFHTYSESAFPENAGNHEGDWGAVDLTVKVPIDGSGKHNIGAATILDAIVHEHGNPHRFPIEDLEFEEGHLVIFLEKGTNEGHPKRGGPSRFKGIPKVADFPVVRSHRGGGYRYPTAGHVINIADPNLAHADALDAKLLRLYAGKWGAYEGDVDINLFVAEIKYDANVPMGPLFNDKFMRRYGVIDHRGR